MKNDLTKHIANSTTILGAMLGMLVFILIYGIRVLDPTYDDWIMTGYQDLVQHYLGWVSYRNSSWHFPVGLIENIVYPDMISVIYTDSIPLFAFISKILSPILPETFQYFGIFGLICFALMGYFSTRILCYITGNGVYSLLGSLFFDISYIMLDRMFFHTALGAHFIILAAICYWYIDMGGITVRHKTLLSDQAARFAIKNAVVWTLLSVLALLIEAYFMPMVWGIMLCALLTDLYRTKRVTRVITPILSAGLFTILTGWCFGVFYGDVSAANGGLGTFSFNLNAFFDSRGKSTLFPALFSYPGQHEGFNYLGCGMFFLIAACVIKAIMEFARKTRIVRCSNPDKQSLTRDLGDDRTEKIAIIIPHILFVVCFMVFAISPVITFNEWTYTVHIPEFLYDAWSVFRSSGRMAWPVYYLIIILVLSYIGNMKHEKIAVIILLVGLSLQIYDERGFIRERQERYLSDITYQSSLNNEVWDEIASEYDHIMFYPNTFSVNSNYRSLDLWYFAQENDLTTNIVYLSRDLCDKVDKEAYEHFVSMRDEGKEYPDTMYIFLDQFPEGDFGLYYYEVDGLTIGVPRKL